MKGKKILALTSLFASVAIVGSTMALWAVTDNAGEFSVKISPGTIESDTTTKFVTLSYGDRSYANVGNIVNGTKRLAASVELQAAWEYDVKDTSFTGQFQLELTQDKASGEKLINHLHTYVYDAAPTVTDGVVTAVNGNLVGEVTSDDADHKSILPITLTNSAGSGSKKVYVVVEYETVAASLITTMASDSVKLSMDWMKTDDLVTAYTVYYSGSLGTGELPYIYAWTKVGEVVTGQNDDYPGIAMTKVRDGLYSYELNNNYTHFILAKRAGTADPTKIINDDIVVSSWVSTYKIGTDQATPCYDGTKWAAVPSETEGLNYDYYIAGNFSQWERNNNYGLTHVSGAHYRKESITLAKDDQFKVVNKNYDEWFLNDSIWDAIAPYVELYYNSSDNTTNLKVKLAGTYDIDFYNDSANPIVIAPHANA